jgi:hypothetical protein
MRLINIQLFGGRGINSGGSFKYKGKTYYIDDHGKPQIWIVGTEIVDVFENIEEFSENLKIDDVTLKDIWSNITKI